MTSDIQSLLSRLKAATEGSRELDMDIRCAIGLPDTFCYHKVVCWHRKADGWWDCETDDGFLHFEAADTPHYTTSVDAALSHEADGFWEISGPRKYLHIPTESPNRWRAVFWYGPEFNAKQYEGWGATEALARRVAALRARGA
jgi:hypothetical protein